MVFQGAPMSLRSLSLIALLLNLLVAVPAALAAPPDWSRSSVEHDGAMDITVYRSPTCGCCSAWIDHLEAHGFSVRDVVTDDVADQKQRLGVPQKLASCHTAVIDGYVIEGHVPADDIKRLLNSRRPVAGLAVPGMPAGSPGMEMGERKDDFPVVAFDRDGEFSLFNHYQDY